MLTLFTDPHIGLKRAAHTTQASALRLQARLLEQVDKVPGQFRLCLGDLFDRHSNDEAVILEGMRIANACDMIIGGNHDVSNRSSAGSLDLLHAAGPHCRVVVPQTGQIRFAVEVGSEFAVYGVPHHTTQALFDDALVDAKRHCSEREPCKWLDEPRDLPSVLLLHCNYDSGFTEGREAALNLTRARAAELLECFDFIAIGHEHIPRSDFDGRLQVLGNTLPLGFGEIADRFFWSLDKAGFHPHLLWDSAQGYREVDAVQILEGVQLPEVVEFVRVRGELDHTKAPAFAKALAGFWKAHPNLLMLKSDDVEFAGRSALAPQAAAGRLNLADVILAAMPDERMRALFNRYVEHSDAE